jgi:hypothetical protein
MPLRLSLLSLWTVALLLTAPTATAQPSPAPSLVFDGVTYVHRWAQDGQHEFTPAAQTDLRTWTDMVTVTVHDEIADGEQLATAANGVLSSYQSAGRLLHTASRPRTATAPAEHFVAAVLGDPAYLEASFARLLLVGGRGVVVVYSHRVYGEAAGPPMSAWLGEHGQEMEQTLMGWPDVAAVVQALPDDR